MKITRNPAKRGYHIFIGDKDLKEASMSFEKYYKPSREEQWLREDNPYNIGGRLTDIGQIGLSLTVRIKELYPINQVPEDIVKKLDELETLCNRAEEAIEEFIEFVSEIRAKEKSQ